MSRAAHTLPSFGDETADTVLNALPHPILMVAPDGKIVEANVAAEAFFEVSMLLLRRHQLRDLVPFGSPLLALIEQVRNRGSAVNEYRVDLSTPRTQNERIVDLNVAPVPERPGHVVVMLQERTIADKMDRQLTHRGAARSVIALAAMLAHEIKNPLSGIRGAAQLLEQSAVDDDRTLTRLICDEADRIVKLVDRMEVFADERPIEREPVNIHVVLDRVKKLAQTGFARHIRFVETYDPSLPSVLANRDQFIQVFLNLVKLVDRMEVFADERPVAREPVNIHVVLDRVKKLAQTGFARHIRFVETYDPSLPSVLANRDQFIQVFLNLVKNASEAIGEQPDGQIELTTAFRPGVRLQVPGSKTRVSLPLEFCVRDNGAGVPADLLPHLFDPFVTTKPTGTGLGLALVAKIVGDHGGIIECESQPRHTIFRVLMPMFTGDDAVPGGET